MKKLKFSFILFTFFLVLSCNNTDEDINLANNVSNDETTINSLETLASDGSNLAILVSQHSDFIYTINKMTEAVPNNCDETCIENQINVFISKFQNIKNDIPELASLSMEEQAEIFQEAEELNVESSMGCKMFCFIFRMQRSWNC